MIVRSFFTKGSRILPKLNIRMEDSILPVNRFSVADISSDRDLRTMRSCSKVAILGKSFFFIENTDEKSDKDIHKETLP